MPFAKKTSGNPFGRPIGAKNKAGRELRERIGHFLEKKFDTIERDWRKMDREERRRLYVDLMPYYLPKMQSVEVGLQIEQLNDDQLDALYSKVMSSINPGNE